MLSNVDEQRRYAGDRRCAKLLAAACIMLGLASCASITEPTSGHAPLLGLIVDHSGRPITGAVVRIGDQSASSSEDGLFSLPGIDSLSFDLSAEHERHLPYSGKVERTSRAEVVVIRLVSIGDIVSAVDLALIAGDLQIAEHWLGRARAEDLHDPRILFLRAIVAYKQNDYARAMDELDSFREPVPDAVRLLKARMESGS